MDVHGQSSPRGYNGKDGIVPRMAHIPFGYNSNILVKYM